MLYLTSHDSQCNCWKDFESGKCKGNVTSFSAQNGEPTSHFPGKYFAKTDRDGWSLPRSAKQKQFVYQHDNTCRGKDRFYKCEGQPFKSFKFTAFGDNLDLSYIDDEDPQDRGSSGSHNLMTLPKFTFLLISILKTPLGINSICKCW